MFEAGRTTLQKMNGIWIMGYFDKNGINQYLTDSKTKDGLIHKLAEKWLPTHITKKGDDKIGK